MNNKELRTKYQNTSYVIIVERDNCKKYISKDFPFAFQYTVKIQNAKRFRSVEDAQKFIDYQKHFDNQIINPKIQKCIRTFRIEEDIVNEG